MKKIIGRGFGVSTGARNVLRLAIIGLVALVVSCSADDKHGTDSNSNWLMSCDTDAACGDGLQCICGICTVHCTSDDECERGGSESSAICSAPAASECAGDAPICIACSGDDCETASAGDDSGAPAASSDAGDVDEAATSTDEIEGASDDPTRDDSATGEGDAGSTDSGTNSSQVGEDGADPPDAGDGTGDPAGTGDPGDAGSAQDLPIDTTAPPAEGAEECDLPIGEWIKMADQPELDHAEARADLAPLHTLRSSTAWHDGRLRYVGTVNSSVETGEGSSLSTSDIVTASFDPCTNSWEMGPVPTAMARVESLGWDGKRFVFGGITFSSPLSITPLRFYDDSPYTYVPGADDVEPLTQIVALDDAPYTYLAFPDGTAPTTVGSGLPSDVSWASNERHLFMFGGSSDSEVLGTGQYLDLATGSWQPMASEGAPSPRVSANLGFAGERFVVLGGTSSLDAGENLLDGAFYDPNTDEWEPIEGDGAPVLAHGPRSSLHFSWTGSRLQVLDDAGLRGGVYTPGDGWTLIEQDPARTIDRVIDLGDGRSLLLFGGQVSLLDSATGTIIDDIVPGQSVDLEYFQAVWSGRTLMLWHLVGEDLGGCSVPDVTGCDLVDEVGTGSGLMVRVF